jgi:hypothetical protein
MINGLMTPPILYIIFNRPDLMEPSFARIRAARPAQLFIAADGPRLDRAGEAAACAEARRIVEQVDWPCEVKTLFREQNLGCRQSVSSAITWFFAHVEAGIILEDDCVADASFFPFCAELLERYRADERVMMISGDNFLPKSFKKKASYYFSRYPHCTGWASWRDRWQKYADFSASWPAVRESAQLHGAFSSERERRYWLRKFDWCFNGSLDSWATIWSAACWYNGGLTVLPSVNLVQHIGWGEAATHTKAMRTDIWRAAESMPFPLAHPVDVVRNKRADAFTERFLFSGIRPPLRQRLQRMRWMLGGWVRKKLKVAGG